MIRLTALAAAMCLAACSTTNTADFVTMADTLHRDGCNVTIHANAQAGVVGGAGANFQGDIVCTGIPPVPPPPTNEVVP